MKFLLYIFAIISMIACKETGQVIETETNDFTLVFASCSHQDMEQPLWKPISATNPDLFIWGGDNVYTDTDDLNKMKADYQKVWSNPDYAQLASKTTIIGTWDDHDYGKNDAGVEWGIKKGAQQVFLDFLKVSENDPRRNREGVYTSENFTTKKGTIKVILLDTRYFRDSLQKSNREGVRYDPWEKGEGGSVLGEAQWKWLKNELTDKKPDFTVIVSSIQFLADEHNWEKWGNFPDEVAKLHRAINNAVSKNIFILSGDRHLAEFSVSNTKELSYPLIDFTTSGMTKVYPNTPEDSNRYRVGHQVKQLNFGVIKFDFKNKKVTMEIRGEENKLYDRLVQKY